MISLTAHIRKKNPLIQPYTSVDERLSTGIAGRTTSKHVPVSSQLMKEARCSCLSRHMKDSRYRFIHMLKRSSFFWIKDSSMSCLSDSCKMYWKTTLGTNESKGARSDNPTARQFGYDLTIASQRDIAVVIRGNVGEGTRRQSGTRSVNSLYTNVRNSQRIINISQLRYSCEFKMCSQQENVLHCKF